MDRNSLAPVVLLALATVVGVSYLPRAARSPAPTTGAKSEISTGKAGDAKGGSSGKPNPCGAILDRLARFYPDGFSAPEFCGTNATKPATGATMKAIVTLIPNPIQTHLQLYFDRATEAIQQAAQDEGYSYDSSWFPWDDSDHSFSRLEDQQAYRSLTRASEEQPGVIVFRHITSTDTGAPNHPYEDGLVVFVVGEQPTRGVDDKQFENAMAWAKAFDPSAESELLILGPTTSGALPSLERELRRILGEHPSHKLKIFSPTVSSDSVYSWFACSMSDYYQPGSCNGECDGKPCRARSDKFQFRTFLESDALLTDRFCRYIQKGHYDIHRVAIVSEDETAYGKSALDAPETPAPADRKKGKRNKPVPVKLPQANALNGCDGSQSFYYPRDIASLRAAYQKQSIFSGADDSANGPPTQLRGDVLEPGGAGHDTMRSYGGELDALAQEAVLVGISERLRAAQIQYVLIRSSNTLDQVFLAEFFRRSYPEGRVVLDGADLLLRRSNHANSLRGVLTLSSYPLLQMRGSRANTLRAPDNGSARVFGVDSAESLYIAARELLAPSRSDIAADEILLFPPTGEHPKKKGVPIHDYLAPNWPEVCPSDPNDDRNHRPPTWISVIGARRFWPIAVLNSKTLAEECGKSDSKEGFSLLEAADNADIYRPNVANPEDNRRLMLPLPMKCGLLLCVLLALVHAVCCWRGSILESFHPFAQFAPLPRKQHRSLVFVGSLLIAMIAAEIAVATGLIAPVRVLRDQQFALALFVTIVLLLLAMVALLGNYSIPVLCGGRVTTPIKLKNRFSDLALRMRMNRRLLGVGLGFLLLGSFGFWLFLHLYLVRGLTDANLVPTIMRGLNLINGVSPLMPQLMLLVGLYAWVWCNLHGLALVGDDRPMLPREIHFAPEHGLHAEPPPMRIFGREQMQQPVERKGLPWGRWWLLRLPFFFLATATTLRLALRSFGIRSLGEMHFGYLIFWWLSLMAAFLLSDLLQLVATFAELRSMLVLLDRLPLRRTLAAMKGMTWGTIWKASGNVLEQRYRTLSRQFESLIHIYNLLKAKDAPTPDEAIALARVTRCLQRGREFATWYGDLRTCCAVNDISPMCRFHSELARTSGAVMEHILVPSWRQDTASLLLDDGSSKSKSNDAAAPAPLIVAGEEFFLLPYIGFIQNVLGRLRTIIFGMLALFVSMALALSSYPFDPLPVLAGFLLTMFILVGAAVAYVYAGLERDTTLSHLSNTTPGELGMHFWGQIFTFGVGPALALLTTLFPSLTDFLSTWLQPGSQALK